MRNPPWIARRLLELVPHEYREPVVGDLVQEYQRMAETGARFRAWLWFWRETLGLWYAFGGRWAMIGDVPRALRTLARSPMFLVLTSGTLAVGIGAVTAIFSLVDPLLIRALPYPNADRVVMVWERGGDGLPSTMGYATYADIARASRTLESMAVATLWQPVIGHTDPERVTGERVTTSYFATLGVQPALGRNFTADEDRPGKNRVVLLSDRLWRRRFGAAHDVVGQATTINGQPYTVVGVMPATFDDVIWPGAEVWQPLGYDATVGSACRTCRHLQMVARLGRHVTVRAALAELDVISARIVAEHPTEYPASGMLVDQLQHAVMRTYQPVLLALGGAVLLLLLITTANVAGLQLARGIHRRTEFAVRTALGAGRVDLAMPLVGESLAIAVLGGVGACVVAWLTLPVLVSYLPSDLPRIDAIHLDITAFLATAACVLTIGIGLGLFAASRGMSSGDARMSLRSGASWGSRERRVSRVGLVIGEFALALMLLVAAGLVGRSLLRLLSVNVGFDPQHLVSLEMNAAGPAYAQDDAVYAYHDRILAAVRAVPGVEHAALASQIPLAGNMDGYGVVAQDKPLPNPELAPSADRYVVSSDFRETMRTPLLRGRFFVPADFADSAAKVAVVSRLLATEIWPGEDAIGKRIQLGGPTAPWRTVVGVVGDIHHQSLDAAGTGQFYVPEREWQWSDNGMTLLVRVAGDPAAFAPTIRAAAAAVDPTQPISRVATMQHIVLASTARRRVAMILFSAFALFALVLAAGGVYGILASSVAERTREIGVRCALGATPGRILRMFVSQGVQLVAIGALLGVLGAFVLTRFLRTLLFEVQPMDPVTLMLVGATLGAVALAACVIPAVRAIRIHPVSALKSE
jgi:putative ABC transport system permease protein